jgi:hypothetical protein
LLSPTEPFILTRRAILVWRREEVGMCLREFLRACWPKELLLQKLAIFGVYQHGAAGDRAAQKCTQPALIASDIINEMGW